MRVLRCSPWSLLVVVILADAAPAPSCGKSGSADGYLQVGASDCTCAPAAIEISLDGRPVAQTSCGWDHAITLATEPGTHVVGASGTNGVWPDRTFDVRSDRTTPVELGCPPGEPAARR